MSSTFVYHLKFNYVFQIRYFEGTKFTDIVNQLNQLNLINISLT